jgi:mRNA interferase HigB
MRIVSRKKLLIFSQRYPDTYAPLDRWYRTVKSAEFRNFSDLRQIFGPADVYKDQTIFDIGGNKYRLIAGVRYAVQAVYVHYILTHQEYDAGDWKNGH